MVLSPSKRTVVTIWLRVLRKDDHKDALKDGKDGQTLLILQIEEWNGGEGWRRRRSAW